MSSTTESARERARDTSAEARLQPRSRIRKRAATVTQAAILHPVVAVTSLALLVRVATAIVLASRGGYTIPDEGQYVDLARYVADGRGAEAWYPGYGQSLYHSTYAFSAPLADLFRIFGPHRLIGQLIAAVLGAATAGLATWLARRVLPVGWALLAGGLVAFLPSQVLFSSVVLRESMVWCACAVIAVGVTLAASTKAWSRLLIAALLAAGGLLALGFLREQTAFIALWALLIAVCAFSIARPVVVRLGVLAIALVVSIVSGLGPLGYGLVHRSAPGLAEKRIDLGVGASTSFVHPKPVPSGKASAAPTPQPSATATSPGHVVKAADGKDYAIDNSPTSVALHAFPTGIVAVTVRPYPWETPTSTTMRFAQLEDVLWGALYVLAALGAWAGRRRREVLAYPFAFAAGILLLGAVTQGNLGTAFRHRGQILWALAPLAALGLHWLVATIRSRRSSAIVA